MKILYVDPYSNTSYSKTYLYYEGLYNALVKNHDVVLYRDCLTDYNHIKAENPFSPDFVLFGLSWFEKHKYFESKNNQFYIDELSYSINEEIYKLQDLRESRAKIVINNPKTNSYNVDYELSFLKVVLDYY